MTMSENVDVYDELADKMIGWMDCHHLSSFRVLARLLRSNLPASHERQVALRKLLEAYGYARNDISGSKMPEGELRNLLGMTGYCLWEIESFSGHERELCEMYKALDRSLGPPMTIEAILCRRLLLESRDAAVRAYLEWLAEQQKQEQDHPFG